MGQDESKAGEDGGTSSDRSLPRTPQPPGDRRTARTASNKGPSRGRDVKTTPGDSVLDNVGTGPGKPDTGCSPIPGVNLDTGSPSVTGKYSVDAAEVSVGYNNQKDTRVAATAANGGQQEGTSSYTPGVCANTSSLGASGSADSSLPKVSEPLGAANTSDSPKSKDTTKYAEEKGAIITGPGLQQQQSTTKNITAASPGSIAHSSTDHAQEKNKHYIDHEKQNLKDDTGQGQQGEASSTRDGLSSSADNKQAMETTKTADNTGEKELSETKEDNLNETKEDNLSDTVVGLSAELQSASELQDGFDLRPADTGDISGITTSDGDMSGIITSSADMSGITVSGTDDEDAQTVTDKPESGNMRHEIMKHASREDGGECLYIPDDVVSPPSSAHHELESIMSPDSGIEELPDSELNEPADGNKPVLSVSPKRLRLGTASGSTTPEALSEVFSPDETIVQFPSCDLPEELLPQKPPPKEEEVKFQAYPATVTPTRYNDIRELDIAEDFKESVTIVTKLDHERYTEEVKGILHEVIDKLPLPEPDSSCQGDVPQDVIPQEKPATCPTEVQSVPSQLESGDAPPATVNQLNTTYDAEPTGLSEELQPQPEQSQQDQLIQDHQEPEKTQDQTVPEQHQDQVEPEQLPQQIQPEEPQVQAQISSEEQVAPVESVQPAVSPSPEELTASTTSQETQPESLKPEASLPTGEGISEETQITDTKPEDTSKTLDTINIEVTKTVEDTPLPTQPEPAIDATELPLNAQKPVASEEPEEQPLPKGAYTINWDEIDEFSDPFASKSSFGEPKKPKIAASPKVAVEKKEPEPVVKDTEKTVESPEKVASESTTEKNSPEPEPVVQKTDSPSAALGGTVEPGALEGASGPIKGPIGALKDLESVADISLNYEDFPEAEEPPEDLPELTEAELCAPPPETPPAKMAEEEEIPVPKGAYNIDWDNFDDSINPFETKTKVGGLDDKPVGSSKPPAVDFDDPNFDPFKPKKSLMGNSPPSSPKAKPASSPAKPRAKAARSPKPSPAKTNSETVEESADINQNLESKGVEAEPEKLDNEELREGGPHDLNQRNLQDVEKTSPKKKPGSATKKVPKRFKPPARFAKSKQGDEDEIQILAPPPPKHMVSPDEPKPVSHSSPDAEMTDDPRIITNSQEIEVADNEFTPATELFNDPSAWDMLEKFGSANSADFKESALARQSLYVKFDPLVKGQSPVKTARKPSAEAIAESEDSLLLMGTPPPNKSGRGPKHPAARALEAQISVKDPLPVGPEEQLSPQTPPGQGEEGRAEVDRLFACSPAAAEASARQNGTSSAKQGEGMTASTDSLDIVHVLKYSQSDLNRIRKEMELDFQARFLSKERDWERERESLENGRKSLRKLNVDMKSVVDEYELTITQLIAEKESLASTSKETKQDLVKERDQALEDLHSVETAFSDLHRRFEKSKTAIEGFKKNEDMFKKALNDLQQKLKKQEDKYQTLKKTAQEKLDQANTENERVRKASQSDLTRLQAGMKRAELQIQSLEQQIEQKVKENKELTAICDELINKVEH